MSAGGAPTSKSDAERDLKHATKQWRKAMARERATRDALAGLVNEVVGNHTLTEHRVATLTDIPRMTIRKMLGKS